MTREFTVIVTYSDKTEFSFIVKIEGPDYETLASLSMIARGTLKASTGKKAAVYNEQGYELITYEQ